jgi:MinD superfamily P-loop ATPase
LPETISQLKPLNFEIQRLDHQLQQKRCHRKEMKELTIISGKGGSGKTSVTAAFAALAENKIIIDADVDAADMHLILPPTIEKESTFKGGSKAFINLDSCMYCGECLYRCQFDAISPQFVVDQIACEGCGVCAHFCPVEAIRFEQKICGKWFVSSTDYGPMVHARLGIAEENSGLLVSLLRQETRKIAKEKGHELIMIDGPPGIGCPVIASVTGSDAVLIVTEPTLSGVHDMERVNELSRFLRVPAMVCVNKYDINPDITEKIRAYAEKNQMKYVGSIPYDRDVTAAMVARKPLVVHSQGPAAQAVREVWSNVTSHLDRLMPHIYYPAQKKQDDSMHPVSQTA